MQKLPVRVWLCVSTLVLCVSGCRTAIQCCTQHFAWKAASPADRSPLPESTNRVQSVSATDEQPTPPPADDAAVASGDGQQVRRFQIPAELPGADAAPLQLPPLDTTQSIADRRSLAETLFPQVGEPTQFGDELQEANGTPLTLGQLQQMAVDASPVIRTAAAAVEEMRGHAVQAGLYPNPTVGYEGDTIGTARTAGYNGVFFTQEFVTAGKLNLAQQTALMQVRAAEADLRRARIELASAVRRAYFQTLVAQEQVIFSRAILKLSEEVYQAQIDLVAGGEAAPYEPLQLRVFAVQARNNVTIARNNLNSTWRQLAAAMGTPHMRRQAVAGSVESLVPPMNYDQAVAAMMSRHSDLIAARARVASAGCNLRLQQVSPIPNVNLYAAFQHDDTTPLSDYSTNVQLSVPVPVFNRNQGNITTAHASLVRANQELVATQNGLMSSLADAWNRYASGRVVAESYRSDLVPDQVRVYRGVYDRFRLAGGDVDFAQVVLSQQTLTQIVSGYLQSLGDQWDATIDLAELLQVDDLMTFDGMSLTVPAESTDQMALPLVPAAPDDDEQPPAPQPAKLDDAN